MPPRPDTHKTVDHLRHNADRRKVIPSAEHQSVLEPAQTQPRPVRYPRNTDLDPQLVWRGKDEQDGSDLVAQAPPLYIQERIHPKVLIDDLLRQSSKTPRPEDTQTDLFADFNGIPEGADRTEFYQHDLNWTNRMILGDSLQVMASLAEREGLRGKVQCIYLDPPYGIKFNSNFQWSTTSRDVKDGNTGHITREPEQVKAFRDTWRDGIHSYLTYLRDRLTLARDLLTDSGSIFVQIGDENVHRVRAVMDEVFGDGNACSVITFVKTTGFLSNTISNVCDYLLWYAKDRTLVKYRQALFIKEMGGYGSQEYTMARMPDGRCRPLSKEEKDNPSLIPSEARVYRLADMRSQGASAEGSLPFVFEGVKYPCGGNMHWKTSQDGLHRLTKSDRLTGRGLGKTLCYNRYIKDFAAFPVTNIWTDAASGDNQVLQKLYVVQTLPKVIERCLLMATDPGDLVLDPTCGSGTTAYVAEQWGRRWITIDTSRVALALARARIMGARYPFYLLADSREGQRKEAEVTGTPPSIRPVQGNIRHGFVYERVPHITLKSIANNAEIDVIWARWQQTLEPLRAQLNAALGKAWQEWEIPRDAEDPWDPKAQKLFHELKDEQKKAAAGNPNKQEACLQALNQHLRRTYTLQTLPARPADPWAEEPTRLHTAWWEARIARQQEIDKSIAAKAEFEYLYDKPYEDKKRVRVAGPFTVESLSPHRMLGMNEDDGLIDPLREPAGAYQAKPSFPEMILDTLRQAGVQQAHREDRISFTTLVPWPGELVCAEGRYQEGETERRAAIFIGPEFGTVQRPDLVAAAREAGDAGFDVLIACAFNYEAQATDFSKLGRIAVLKARMNADLHMAEDLKNTGKGNLFVIFGEPDIDLLPEPDGRLRVQINGVDIFKPQTGEVVSDGPDGIACWFLDTDYNEESFFVRHAYFLGASDPYKALRTTLKAEIDADAWATLYGNTSRPFDKPTSGRIAVKVINHLGDEVMKVFRVE